MTLYHAFDASTPPDNPYPGSRLTCGYLGPAGYTPHIWTLDEWNQASAQGTNRVLPIWLSDFTANPATQAQEAAQKAVSLGWRPHAEIEELRYIVIDGEDDTEHRLWRQDFASALYQAGFLALDYRSVDALLRASSGLDEWVAHWDVPPGPITEHHVMFQYEHDIAWEETTVDLSVLSDIAWIHMGRGLRRNVGT